MFPVAQIQSKNSEINCFSCLRCRNFGLDAVSGRGAEEKLPGGAAVAPEQFHNPWLPADRRLPVKTVQLLFEFMPASTAGMRGADSAEAVETAKSPMGALTNPRTTSSSHQATRQAVNQAVRINRLTGPTKTPPARFEAIQAQQHRA